MNDKSNSMKIILTISIAACVIISLASCKSNKNNFDASGSFEAEETIISSEASGTIKQFNIEEGQVSQAGQMIGYIDSIQLFLRKKQLEAQLKATGKRSPDIVKQTGFYSQQEAVTQSRLTNLIREQKRFQNLVNADAATQKQLDDINAQIDETQNQLLVTGKQKMRRFRHCKLNLLQ